jgi:hypothetical protein
MAPLSVSITASTSPFADLVALLLDPLAEDTFLHCVRQPGHQDVGHQLPPSVERMTRLIAPASGSAASSSDFAYGSGTSAAATRWTGASR